MHVHVHVDAYIYTSVHACQGLQLAFEAPPDEDEMAPVGVSVAVNRNLRRKLYRQRYQVTLALQAVLLSYTSSSRCTTCLILLSVCVPPYRHIPAGSTTCPTVSPVLRSPSASSASTRLVVSSK